MKDERNIFIGIPMTCVAGLDRATIEVRTEIPFRPTYIVVPTIISADWILEALVIRGRNQLGSGVGIHVGVFGVDNLVLRDLRAQEISDLPLPMKMDDLFPENALYLTIFNINPAARNFLGAVAGPPL